jgi:hypothetical protein
MRIADVSFDYDTQSFHDHSITQIAVTKTGTFKSTPPLTSKTINAIRITPSNSLTLVDVPVAVRSHEEEGFLISFYFKPGQEFSSEQAILADNGMLAGFTFVGSTLKFWLTDKDDNSYIIKYNIPYIGNSYHIIGSYSKRSMSLLVDRSIVSTKLLPSTFQFKSQTHVDLQSNTTEYNFIIDDIEIFNEVPEISYFQEENKLNKSIQNISQILVQDDPAYFSLSRNKKPIESGFTYGSNKDYSYASFTGLEVDNSGNVVLVDRSGISSGYFLDSYFFPPLIGGHNQIDWYSDSSGITVSYNLDGGSSYAPLTNHSSIPNFTGGMLYYKVELSTSNIEVYEPVFRGMSVVSYESKDFYSDNTLYKIESDYNYSVGSFTGQLIDHSNENGIQTRSGGFKVANTTARSVEFLFNPKALTQTSLIDCGSSRYSWSSAGAITKAGIQSIYVNGVNLTSSTTTSAVFETDVWHHVVIVFSADQVDTVYFNQTKTGTMLGPDNRFAHIGVYEVDMSSKATSHYINMTNRVSAQTISDPIIIGSDSFSGYNVDKVVLSTQ